MSFVLCTVLCMSYVLSYVKNCLMTTDRFVHNYSSMGYET